MEFRQMRYLITISELQSVSRAAEALHISQSALSHYIKNTEQDLGVKLFDRSTSPLSLTYAGKCYIETAKKILLENERFNRELRDITQHMTGVMRIGTSRERASYMIPKLLPPFVKKYPGIKAEVFTESGQKLREALREGKIDLLFLPDDGKEIPSNICTKIIYSEELLLAAKRGFLKNSYQDKKFITPQEINNKPFFMMFKEYTARSVCDAFFRKNNITPKIIMEFHSNITCYKMASTGLGLAIIPFMTTRLANPDSEVELFSLGEKFSVFWNVLVYWRKDSYMGKPELDLIQMSEKIFSQESL